MTTARELKRKTATQVFTDSDGAECVQYHNTVIAKRNVDGSFTLDDGGWMTATTKRRMNEALKAWGIPASVYQKAHTWYVNCIGLNSIPYSSGMNVSLKIG